VVIGDTMGELMMLTALRTSPLWAAASLKSVAVTIRLEAAAHALPVLMGPHTFNFKDICARLQAADGLITVTDADSLVKEVSTLLTDEDYRLWWSPRGGSSAPEPGCANTPAATPATVSASAESLMSQRLSVVMIAKNAADLLPDCLASVTWADEIVLLDSGSEDNTVELARTAGVKVFIDTDWQGYGVQRQRAQRFASGDYVLMIDTDERVTPELASALRATLASPQPVRSTALRVATISSGALCATAAGIPIA
jgi:hypothetical protein